MPDEPWSTIEIIDGLPVYAHLEADNRVGPIQFKLLGDDVPTDLTVHISELNEDVTAMNATWTFKKTSGCFMISPKDQYGLKQKF